MPLKNKENINDDYKYPQAKRFSNMAELAKKIADDIESHTGHMSLESRQDEKKLSRLIDFLCDTGHLNLKCIKVVQGLSISEIMRLANPQDSSQI